MKQEKVLFKFSHQFGDILTLGNGHIPAFLYRGNQPVLFDPGVSAFGPFYLKKIKEHVTNPQSLIIALTHSHFDHCGAVPYLLRKIPEIKIVSSSRAAAVLKRPNAVSLMQSLNAEYEKEMVREIESEDVSFESIDINFELHDGGKLELDNGKYFEVLETPGHTRDCLSFFSPEDRALFSGEAAGVFEDGFIHSPFLSSYEDYINSLKKLSSLKPDALCIAHNGMLTGRDVDIFFSKSLNAAVGYKEMIESLLSEYNGNKQKVVAKITFEEYDSRPDHIQKRQPFILNLEAKVNAVARSLESDALPAS